MTDSNALAREASIKIMGVCGISAGLAGKTLQADPNKAGKIAKEIVQLAERLKGDDSFKAGVRMFQRSDLTKAIADIPIGGSELFPGLDPEKVDNLRSSWRRMGLKIKTQKNSKGIRVWRIA